MRKNWLVLILATILVTLQYDANAQKNNRQKFKQKANDPINKRNFGSRLAYANQLFSIGSYFNAIDYYSQLKAEDERNPFISNQLGDCYRFTRDYVPAAHYYMEVRAMGKSIYPLSTFYAGLMLKQQGEYVQAMDLFNEFLADNKKTSAKKDKSGNELIDNNSDRTTNPKQLKELKKQAKMEIDGCIMAISSIKNPEPVTILNCGPNVNTVRTELSPFPLGDTALIFGTTGRNPALEAYNLDESHNFEHFMIAQKQKGYVDSFQWPLPFNDGNFNDPNAHTANGCISPGGGYFFFSKCTEGDTMMPVCNIFVSSFAATGWGAPVLIGNEVNGGLDRMGRPASNFMPWVAKVGKKDVLFFSSNRKLQGRGGYDIWYSIMDPRNGSFRRPQNAGKVVNTTRDELTPYYDTRVKKLYFASNGQKSFGGFDIYSVDGGPSRYTNIKNMGYPINSSADEFYYIKDPVGKPDAYVVSNRIGSFALKNPTCCNDIWRIQQEPRLVVIGKVLSKRTQDLMPQTVVKMVDQKGEMNTYNSEDGNFLFNMSRGRSYIITGDKPGYTSSRASVSTMEIKRSDPDDTIFVTIFLDSVRNSFSVSNIYYDYDKATLRAESVASLDSVVHFLTDNPSITVDIYSYTDAKGTDEYNLALSQRRAQSVMDYLEKNGIDRKRLGAKGFGSKNAAAPNSANGKDNPEGRQLNRRTEFRIITDLPTRRVLYNSALPGTMDQQEKNLQIEPEADDEPAAPGAKKQPAANEDDE